MILYNVHVYSGYIIRRVKLGKNQGWGIKGDSQDLTGGADKVCFHMCKSVERSRIRGIPHQHIVARRNFRRGGGACMPKKTPS